MIEHFEPAQSSSAAWLREMRAMATEGDLEFQSELRPIVSRDFMTGAADEPPKENP